MWFGKFWHNVAPFAGYMLRGYEKQRAARDINERAEGATRQLQNDRHADAHVLNIQEFR